MITEPNEDIPWKGTMRAITRPNRTNRVLAKTVVTIIVTITVNAVIIINVTMIIANTTTMIETITIINVLTMTIVNMITIIVVTTMTPTFPGTTVIRTLHTGQSSVTTIVAITTDVDATMIAAITTINVRATIVVTTTIIVRMTGVAITTIVNKTITPTGIIAETHSGVTAIIPRGMVVTTRILVIMTTRTEEIIRRIIVNSITFETTPTTTSVRKMATPKEEVVRNPHRVTVTAPQGTLIKTTIVVIKITPTGAIVIPTGVSTTTTSTRRNVRMRVARLHEQPYAVQTTLSCSKAATHAFPTT